MKVVDASILVTALADEGGAGARMRDAVRDVRLAAPYLIDLEVVAAWRRQFLRGLLSVSTWERALQDLADTPIQRHPPVPLLRRCWELLDNVKTYDAAYVALAEVLGVPLLTADARLANADGIRCEVELLT